MATAVTTDAGQTPQVRPTRSRRRRRRGRPNWLGGLAGWLWLVIVIVPIYWIVITSFKTQANYYAMNPLKPSTSPTIDNYRLVIESDFATYFINSAIVTVGSIIPAVLISFMAAFAIVRSSGRFHEVGQRTLPDGTGDSAAGDHHPRLSDHHPAEAVRQPPGDHLAVDRVRNSVVGAGPCELHPRCAERALRVHAGRRGQRMGSRCGASRSR